MVGKTIKQIIDGLNDYLGAIYNPGLPSYNGMYAVMKHLKKDSFDASGSTKIAVNLINIEEDTVYRNQHRTHPNGNLEVMRLHLYVLFAFHPGDDAEKYADALTLLTHVLRYFQGRPSQEITVPGQGGGNTFTVEIMYHNISLEDSHNMWSNLGGEQKPYAMYKVQLVEIVPEPNTQPVPVIHNPVVTIGSH